MNRELRQVSEKLIDRYHGKNLRDRLVKIVMMHMPDDRESCLYEISQMLYRAGKPEKSWFYREASTLRDQRIHKKKELELQQTKNRLSSSEY